MIMIILTMYHGILQCKVGCWEHQVAMWVCTIFNSPTISDCTFVSSSSAEGAAVASLDYYGEEEEGGSFHQFHALWIQLVSPKREALREALSSAQLLLHD